MKSVYGSNNSSKEKQASSAGKKCRTQMNSAEKKGSKITCISKEPKNPQGIRTTVNLNLYDNLRLSSWKPTPEAKEIASIQKLVNKHYVNNVNQPSLGMKLTSSATNVLKVSNNLNLKLNKNVTTGSESATTTHKVSTNSQGRSINNTIIKPQAPINLLYNQTSKASHIMNDNSGFMIKNLKGALLKENTKKYSRNSPNINKVTHRQDNTIKQITKKIVPSKSNINNDMIILTTTFGSKAENSMSNANFKYLNTTSTNCKTNPNTSCVQQLATHRDETKHKSKNMNNIDQTKYQNEELNVQSNYKSSMLAFNYSNLHSNSNSQSTNIFSCNNTNKNSKNISRNNYVAQSILDKPQLQYSKIESVKFSDNNKYGKSGGKFRSSYDEENAEIPEGMGLVIDMNNGSTLRINYKSNNLEHEENASFQPDLSGPNVRIYDQLCQKLVKEPNNFCKAAASQDYFSEHSVNIQTERQIPKNSYKDNKTASSHEATQAIWQGRNFESTTENMHSLHSMKIDGPEEFHYIQVRFGIRYTRELAFKFERLEEIKKDNQNGNFYEIYDSDDDAHLEPN